MILSPDPEGRRRIIGRIDPMLTAPIYTGKLEGVARELARAMPVHVGNHADTYRLQSGAVPEAVALLRDFYRLLTGQEPRE